MSTLLGKEYTVEEEDGDFRYLVRILIENLPHLHEKFSDKEFPHVAAEDHGVVPFNVQQNIVKALYFNMVMSSNWAPVWSQYYAEITKSDRNYVQFTLFSCLIAFESVHDFHDRFLDVLGMVAGFSLAFTKKFDYYKYAAPLLIVLFEKVMTREFYGNGGWTGLGLYLEGLPYLDWYHLKDDIYYRSVGEPLVKEVVWRSKGKSYNNEIRLFSIVEAIQHRLCYTLASQVLVMDTTVCDRPDDLSQESLLANENIARVRGRLLAERIEVVERVGEAMEADSHAEHALYIKRKEAQKNFEIDLVKVAKDLIKRIEDNLANAKRVSGNLKNLYY